MESVGSIIAYLIIMFVIMASSVMAVTTRKILRSATFLLFALFGTAAVYFLLGYQFLGGVQIAVYAGGIVVLFVFSILLTSRPGDNSKNLSSKKRTIGFVGGAAVFVISVWSLADRVEMLATRTEMSNPDMKVIGESMLSSGHDGYLLAFEAISVLLLACIIGGIVVARKNND